MFEEMNEEKTSLVSSSRAPLLLIVIGVLVIFGSLAWAFGGPIALAFEGRLGNQAEIVNDRPITAIHDQQSMEPPDPASIPFLPEGGPQPRISIEDNFYDFGNVGPKDVVTRDFFIVNRGEAPLTISRAYTTCGCTTAEISASVIPPGKAARVTVNFDAGFHDISGQTVRRGVILESNDPTGWQSEIWVQASVQGK